MKQILSQVKFDEVSDEYKQFVDKFKPKKTTDDCYTPENVYKAVADWVCAEYGVRPEQIVRPFYPGGDYERYPYTDESVVLDNPPFSIISDIVKFYLTHDIPFFLFAPHLTNLSIGRGADICHVIEGAAIMYDNGAVIATSFVTNLDDRLIYASPELYKAIKVANDANVKGAKPPLPTYIYPDNVVTAAMIEKIIHKGIRYELKREDAYFISALDSQRSQGKTIFGSGFLLSEKAAAEKAAAEKAAAEKAAEKADIKVWELSENERRIIEGLGHADS